MAFRARHDGLKRVRKTSLLGLIALGSALFLGNPHLAVAQMTQVDIAGKWITVPAPEGHCQLDPSHPMDSQLYSMQQRVNRGLNDVLVISARCKELRRWRLGLGYLIQDVGVVLNPANPEDQVPDLPRSTFVAKFAETERSKDSIGNMKKTIQERASEILPQIRMGETSYLGLIEVTNDAAYTGLIQSLSTNYGRTRVIMISVTAITVVEDRTVFATLMAPFEDDTTIEIVLARQKKFIRALLAAN